MNAMNRKVWISCLVIALILMMTGCGGKTKNEDVIGINPEKIASEQGGKDVAHDRIKWNVGHVKTPHGFENATLKDGKVYGCYYDNQGIKVSVCDPGTGQELANYSIGELAETGSISVGADNEILVFGLQDDNPVVWTITQQSGEITRRDQFMVNDVGLFPRVKRFVSDKNGFYYLWYYMSLPCSEVYGEDCEDGVYTLVDRIYVLDKELNCVCQEQIPDSNLNKLTNLLFDEDDRPFLLAMDADGYYTRRVRTEQGEEHEKKRIEGVKLNELETGDCCAMTSEGILYLKNGAIHLFHLEEARNEKLMELAEAGIFEEDVIWLGTNGDGIEILDNYKGSSCTEYSVLARGEEKERITVTLGIMQMTPRMKNAVAGFNRNQTEITVEPVTYADDYDYQAGFERLKLDIVSGSAPDMIATEGIDVDLLANAGAFMNLYSFMETDDQCNKDALVDSVLKAYENDGKLYVVAPNFYIFSMWGGKSIVRGRSGVCMKDLMQILRENNGDINGIYGFSADESVIRTLCALCMDEFIDWNEGTCHFASEDFQNVMKFAKEYQGKRFESLYNAIRNKEILFVIQNVSCVEDYCLWSGIFGEDVEFIGFPTATGSGTAAYFDEGLAILSKTTHDAECWKFVKQFVLDGYERGTGFPLVKTELEKVFDESMQENTVPNVNGGIVKMAKKSYGERNNPSASVTVYKASKSDVEAVRKMIKNISGKHAYHNDIMNVIDEEAESYFCGQKSIEKVADIIQKRIQLYLKENMEK